VERRELVTAALLGTDRRPVPAADGEPAVPLLDPAVLLLDRAVRSSLAGRAGAVLPRLPAPPAGSAEHPDWAPPAAQQVMARLVVRPQAALIDLWLRAAAGAGLGLAPQHWAAVAAYAYRSAEVSRPLLAAVLGEAGQWFVAQNPQWAELAGALHPNRTEAAALVVAPLVEPEQLQRDPELIFVAADPWPRSLVEVALMIIGTGRLQWRTTAYATMLGARLPLDDVPLIRSAAHHFAPPDGPPTSRIVRDAFAELDRILSLRDEIQQVFGTPTADRDHQEGS